MNANLGFYFSKTYISLGIIALLDSSSDIFSGKVYDKMPGNIDQSFKISSDLTLSSFPWMTSL